jgi:hypothetical protein
LYTGRVYLIGRPIFAGVAQERDRMTEREWLTMLHGIGFGGAFLLAYTGGLEALWGMGPERAEGPSAGARVWRLRVALCGMALLAWLACLSGMYVVYPWYRAEPPPGADLAQFPRAYLLADPVLAVWQTLGADWKVHIANLCPILSTAVAAVVLRYGASLGELPQVRQALMALLTVAFGAAAVAGGLGALLTRLAPVH